MDGDGFDGAGIDGNGNDWASQDSFAGANTWSQQPSASGPGHGPPARGGFDLNSQAAAAEFPSLRQYGAFLQGDDVELPPGRGRSSRLPPYRAPRAGAGDGWTTPTAPSARQNLFGGSSSAGASRGGGNGGGLRQRANSATAAPNRRRRGTRAPASGSSGSGLRGRRPPAPRSAGRGQEFGSDAPFDNADDDDVEELASSGGLPVSQGTRAQWNDSNNASMLELCIEQRRAGRYNGAQLNGDGYRAIVDGLLTRRGLVYSRQQVKNQLVILKNIHSFWQYLQVHTGLGRNPDGTVDAESNFWKTHTEVQCSLHTCVLFYHILTCF